MWVATAIVGSAALGGLATYMGAKSNADAINNSTNLQSTASANSLALQKQIFDTQQNNLAPWLASGNKNLSTLNSLMPSLTKPFSFSDYTQSPSYAWQMSQGQDAINNSAAARGGLFSGATGKALESFGQNLANTDYQQAYNNYNSSNMNTYNMLAGLSNPNAVNSANNSAQNYASNYTNTAMGNASSLGNLSLASGQNTANMYSNFGNILNSSLGMGLNYNMMSGSGGDDGKNYMNNVGGGGSYINGAVFNN